MHIDCDTCAMQHTAVCNDCIVTALLDRPKGAVILDFEHERAIRRLQDAGLAPQSQFSDGREPARGGEDPGREARGGKLRGAEA